MNPIYSTKMDKESAALSEGEIDDSNKYASNYESDEFEEEDPDDDFNLPSGHEQNNETYGHAPNLKREIQEQHHLRKAGSNLPQYTSTATQIS